MSHHLPASPQLITVVTGNPNKLREITAIAPTDLELTAQKINLDEIQSLDLQEIVTHKLKQAYALVQKPVVVEDVSAELTDLGGLPGPFVKFFIEKLGRDALFKLAKAGTVLPTADAQTTDANPAVAIRCLAGYYDGTTMLFGEGVVRGTVVEPRGVNGFGFDSTVVPAGETRTVAEMSEEEKNEISHRAQAMRNLFGAIAAHAQKS